MKKISEEWITKAEKDYLVATRELESTPPVPEAVSFHSQQCIEKYLKAILQENEVEFEKIHDLDILGNQCVKFIPNLEEYRNDLIKLSTYAIEVRYPGFDVTKEESTECLKISERLRKLLRQYFLLF